MRVIHRRNPPSPGNTSALVSLLCSVFGEAAQGQGDFGAHLVMGFKARQWEPLAFYSPCSWDSARYILMAITPSI